MQTSRAPGPERTFTFIYIAGEHVLRVVGNDGRWCVSVDGGRPDKWFVTKADAWAAGLAQVGRLGMVAESSRWREALAQ